MGHEHISHSPETAVTPRKTRRDVVKAAVALTALSATGTLFSEKTRVDPVRLPERPSEPFIPGVVMIDFAPESLEESYAYFEQRIFVRNEEALLEDKLGDKYVPEWRRVAGYIGSSVKHVFGGEDPKNEFIRNNPYMAMAMGAENQFQDHGKSVVDGMRRVYWMLDLNSSIVPSIIPIQLGFNPFTFRTEENGSETMTTELNMDEMIFLLNQYPDQEFVNFSWQAGKVGFTYPEMINHGGYERERAVESLRELFKMVDSFPEKLFFAATGNNSDDIREARRALQKNGEWPENVIFAGQWVVDEKTGFGYPRNDVYGADIYVDNHELALWDGSTQSTQTMTALAAYLRQAEGYSLAEIKKILLDKCTKPVTYVGSTDAIFPTEYPQEEAKLFSPQRFIRFLRKNTDYDGEPYIEDR